MDKVIWIITSTRFVRNSFDLFGTFLNPFDCCRLLGYRYIDGVVEKQDKFLKRMSGVVRLYAAILVTEPLLADRAHSRGLNFAWQWFAAILNLGMSKQERA